MNSLVTGIKGLEAGSLSVTQRKNTEQIFIVDWIRINLDTALIELGDDAKSVLGFSDRNFIGISQYLSIYSPAQRDNIAMLLESASTGTSSVHYCGHLGIAPGRVAHVFLHPVVKTDENPDIGAADQAGSLEGYMIISTESYDCQ